MLCFFTLKLTGGLKTMKKIGSLELGDTFRPAHPLQASNNGKMMSRSFIYRVMKKYPQSPYMVIAVRVGIQGDGIYSLSPDAPTIAVREPAPTLAQVETFLGVKVRKKVVGYRLLWDGIDDPSDKVSLQGRTLLRLMKAFAQVEYESRELKALVYENYAKFHSKPVYPHQLPNVMLSMRFLVAVGLVEELMETRASKYAGVLNLSEE